MQVFWFIPTTGDGRYLGDSRYARETNLPYLRQIATAIDHLGFEGVLLPTGNLCEDAWVVASAIMPATERRIESLNCSSRYCHSRTPKPPGSITCPCQTSRQATSSGRIPQQA